MIPMPTFLYNFHRSTRGVVGLQSGTEISPDCASLFK